jgi:hypothetical protein
VGARSFFMLLRSQKKGTGARRKNELKQIEASSPKGKSSNLLAALFYLSWSNPPCPFLAVLFWL